MAYAVKADLTPRRLSSQELAQLTDDAGSGQTVDQVVTDVLNEASGLIDSYARVRYITPLQTSEQVKGLCLDIAEYMLFSRRRRVPQSVTDRYMNAVNFLKDLSVGKSTLDQPTSAAPQTSGGASVADQTIFKFSDDNLKGYL